MFRVKRRSTCNIYTQTHYTLHSVLLKLVFQEQIYFYLCAVCTAGSNHDLTSFWYICLLTGLLTNWCSKECWLPLLDISSIWSIFSIPSISSFRSIHRISSDNSRNRAPIKISTMGTQPKASPDSPMQWFLHNRLHCIPVYSSVLEGIPMHCRIWALPVAV